MPRQIQAIQRMRNNLLRHPHLMTQLNQVMLDIVTIQWSFPFANAKKSYGFKNMFGNITKYCQ